jgi:hypothetical protein
MRRSLLLSHYLPLLDETTMKPGLPDGTPAIEYLLKEVSFSTCDNKFFGELEKEMLIPNNINIYGKIRGATTLKDFVVRLVFPRETTIGYIKQPMSNTLEGEGRVLTYKLEDVINFEDYWWFPLKGETEFSIRMNLLPPFPELKPVGLQIACRPDVAVGLEADVITSIGIEAEEDIDQLSLKLSSPMRAMPGVYIAITGFSEDSTTEPRQSVVSPKNEFPTPVQKLKKGQVLDFSVKTRITADPSNMLFLKCEQDILTAKLLTLSNSTPTDLPCSVTILDDKGLEVPIQKTVRSTILQATAQVMYSPFSIQREASSGKPRVLLQAPAQ